MAAKIAKIQIVRRPGKWGGYKVREITPGGRVLNAYEYQQGELGRIRQDCRRRAYGLNARFIDLDD